MKIFISGDRTIAQLDGNVRAKLSSLCVKGFEVLIGDAAGVDSLVQKFYVDKGYNKVTIFASNGIARNNIGNWNVVNIAVDSGLKGFDFYKQKDIAMATAADYGFMIWNGESKGTLNNIVNLLGQKKTSYVYLEPSRRLFTIDSKERLLQMLSICPSSTGNVYRKLTQADEVKFSQIALS